MAGVKLSDIIQALHRDEELNKLAQGELAGNATESPVSEQVGSTIEDEKVKIQTKLMELAGVQQEAASEAKPEEELNEAQEAPAGEKAVAPGVSQAASAAAPEEMAEVVANALSKLNAEQRKQACKAIIIKMAQMNAVTVDDISDEKIAEARLAEYEAIGRIMAHGFHDESQKIAAMEASGEIPEEEDETSSSVFDLTEEDLQLLRSLRE